MPRVSSVEWLLGYSQFNSGDTQYNIFNPETKKILNSRNVQWATPAVRFDTDVSSRNNLLEKNATVAQALKKLDRMEKWMEVTGKGARRSLRLTPENSSLRESVVCVEEQPNYMELLSNPESFEIYYAQLFYVACI